MNQPHPFIKAFLLAALVVSVLSVFSRAGHNAYAHQSNSQELYDAAKRHFDSGDYRESLDAIEDVLKVDADHAPALRLKSRALIGLFMEIPQLSPDEMKSADARRERKMRQAKLLKEAADSLERFLQLKPDVKGAEGLREQLNSLRIYAEPAVKPESEWTIFSQADVTERARILRRPQPRYPEEARGARLRGSVKLLLVLAADGTVKHILVLQSSSPVLTEAAIEAARKITFETAIKDGRPVSVASSVEYNFETY